MEKLSQWNTRFEISFRHADKILQEPKTLNEIESVLQGLTHRFP